MITNTPLTIYKKNVFFLTTLFCIAVPGSAALKALAIILAWIYVAATTTIRVRSILWFLSIILNLTLSSEVSLWHNVPLPDAQNELSRIVLFFLVLSLAALIADAQALTSQSADRLIVAISILTALLKVAILIAILSGMFSFQAIQDRLGFESVTDDIGFGLQRLQFPSDIAVLFLIVGYTGGKRKSIDLLFLVTITVGVILSFSRYLFAAYVVCLIIRYLRIRKVDYVSGAALSITIIVGLVFSASLLTRFTGSATRESDSLRTEQIKQLSETILQGPLLGKGMGSSVNDFKRNGIMPFSYEVQWYAMTMQLGMLGLGWFAINLIAPFAACIRGGRRIGVFLAIFAVWTFGGFTNPFVTSLGSAFGLGLLLIVLTWKDDGASPHVLSPVPLEDQPDELAVQS